LGRKNDKTSYLKHGDLKVAVKRGFSIIELTVVIGLIGLLAIAMAAIMLTTIVSSNRIRMLTKIKQSGDYAVTQLQSLIRNARGITLCNSLENTSTLINQDGGETIILLEEDDDDVNRIASNSGSYLTPSDLLLTNYTLTCTPSDDQPNLITIGFDLSPLNTSVKSTENATLHFAVSAELRND
jgi:type II secretory pathway pseudopilin PulG